MAAAALQGGDKFQENPEEESPPWHPINLKKTAAAVKALGGLPD